MTLKADGGPRDRLVALISRSLDRAARHNDFMPLEASATKRILVVKPCCFGDVMMATPALRALHHAFKHADVDVVTTEWCAEALRNNPDVAGVHRYPATMTIARFLRLVQRIKSEKYDIGVSLDRSPIVNLLLLLSGIPIRAGIDSAGRGVGLTHRAIPKPNQHETQLYLAVAEALGASAEDERAVYCPTDEARQAAQNLLEGLRSPIIVIHPGGAVNPGSSVLSKRWQAVRYGELASELVERHGASIVVVGAESDADAVQTTVDFTDARVTNLATRLSIPLLAAVCECAQLFIGNDSGMSHLASAVGTPTVTIFGPTRPEMYRPLGPNALFCAPADRPRNWRPRDLRRKAKHPDGEVSINEVTVEEVLVTCETLLARVPETNHP
jgi:heptosyltransferase-2/heptosyltransferase-3